MPKRDSSFPRTSCFFVRNPPSCCSWTRVSSLLEQYCMKAGLVKAEGGKRCFRVRKKMILWKRPSRSTFVRSPLFTSLSSSTPHRFPAPTPFSYRNKCWLCCLHFFYTFSLITVIPATSSSPASSPEITSSTASTAPHPGDLPFKGPPRLGRLVRQRLQRPRAHLLRRPPPSGLHLDQHAVLQRVRDLVPGKGHLAVAEQCAAEQVADRVVLALDGQRRGVLDAGVSGVGDALDALGDDELFVAVAFLFLLVVLGEKSGGSWRWRERSERGERESGRGIGGSRRGERSEGGEREKESKKKTATAEIHAISSLLLASFDPFLSAPTFTRSPYRSGALAIVLGRRNYTLLEGKKDARRRLQFRSMKRSTLSLF